MKIDNPSELLEAYWHSVLGVTSNFSELLQDPSKLAENLAQIQQNPAHFLRDLAIKGKNIEQDFSDFLANFGCGKYGTARLPDYQVWGGKQVFKQPYNIQGTEFYGFFVEGTMKNLQDLCDRALNQPGSPVEYRPVTNYVLISFDVINSMKSIDKPDSEEGYFSENEIIVWVLTMVGKQIGPFFYVERLAWFVPYIFVSNSAALLAGREVYGFPKNLGRVQIPQPNEEPDFFSLDTLMLKTYSPNTKAEENRLMEIRRTNSANNPEAIKSHDSLEDLMQQAIELLLGRDGTIDIPGIGLPLKLADYLIKEEAPMVCLKQFRDIEDGSKACYQAIVEFLMTTTNFYSGKLLGFGDSGSKYELNIFNFASEPIVKDLGLQSQFSNSQVAKIPIKMAFYLNFDFIVNTGKVIWKRP